MRGWRVHCGVLVIDSLCVGVYGCLVSRSVDRRTSESEMQLPCFAALSLLSLLLLTDVPSRDQDSCLLAYASHSLFPC